LWLTKLVHTDGAAFCIAAGVEAEAIGVWLEAWERMEQAWVDRVKWEYMVCSEGKYALRRRRRRTGAADDEGGGRREGRRI
jgi:hypothetical protein